MPESQLAIDRIRADTEEAAAAVHAANRRWTLLEHLSDLYRRAASAHFLPIEEARELQSLAAEEYGLSVQIEEMPDRGHRHRQARVWLPTDD